MRVRTGERPLGFGAEPRGSGVLAPCNVNTKLATARRLLKTQLPPLAQPATPATGEQAPGWRELLLRLTGFDATVCAKSGGAIHSRLSTPGAPAAKGHLVSVMAAAITGRFKRQGQRWGGAPARDLAAAVILSMQKMETVPVRPKGGFPRGWASSTR
jgi:hypothetical protein